MIKPKSHRPTAEERADRLEAINAQVELESFLDESPELNPNELGIVEYSRVLSEVE